MSFRHHRGDRRAPFRTAHFASRWPARRPPTPLAREIWALLNLAPCGMFSAEHLACAIGVAPATVRGWALGRSEPSADRLGAIAETAMVRPEALGLPPSKESADARLQRSCRRLNELAMGAASGRYVWRDRRWRCASTGEAVAFP